MVGAPHGHVITWVVILVGVASPSCRRDAASSTPRAAGESVAFDSTRTTPPSQPTAAGADLSATAVSTADEKQIEAFCSACHVMPPAESFPRDAWHHEVLRGYEFYAKSGRTDLDPPPPVKAIAYFRSRAPVETVPTMELDESPIYASRFRIQALQRDPHLSIPPAVANLQWLPWFDGSRRLVACDMRLGEISVIVPRPEGSERTVVARLHNPCHIEACDLDGDGQIEFVVADLGSFDPDDHDRGRVIWLRRSPEGDVETRELITKLGRVADVRPVDLDRDGRQDLVVAEFGWHATGSIRVYWQRSSDDGTIQFREQVLSSLPGTIHVPCYDFNGDGQLDIVALISQEHERVILFQQQANRTFSEHLVWAAPDPAFGSSGLELVDLDQDGDQDILYSNGDTFDSMHIKPLHGVQWLENLGGGRFAAHRLATLAGAYRAVAQDMDGDGDLDIVASVWLPREPMPTSGELEATTLRESRSHRISLLLIEQTAPGEFTPHALEVGHPHYATMMVADFDNDGDMDIAVGNHLANLHQAPTWGAIWWNQGTP